MNDYLLAVNVHGTTITAMVCVSCGRLFTVTGEHTSDSWGSGCLDVTCDSYDVNRDADLMFVIEPWRIHKETPDNKEKI